MDLFGLKWTILVAEVGYIFYIAANIKPLPVLMYISKKRPIRVFLSLFKYFITEYLDDNFHSCLRSNPLDISYACRADWMSRKCLHRSYIAERKVWSNLLRSLDSIVDGKT